MKKIRTSFLNTAFALLILGLGGCLAIYSARSFGEAPLYFVFRQMLWVGSGILFFLVLSKIPFRIYLKYAWPIGIFFLAMLFLVLFFGVGLNGMRGWFPVGVGVRVQPSEFAKAPFLLLLTKIACQKNETLNFRFWKVFGIGTLFCLLILLEPDFGSATVFFSGMFLVLYLSGFGFYSLLSLVLTAIPCVFVFLVKHEYAMGRIAGYWNPDGHLYGAGWHIKQFQYTLAHGGLWGSEWGGALWSSSYLPLSHSDSAFASIVEAGGVAGGMLIIIGFLMMVIVFRRIALSCASEEARVFLFAAGAFCAVQALLHIGVNTALLPPTGLTLPIFSYGGSSLLGTMGIFGIACSASSVTSPQAE